eukprot:TRINITY_DN19018_c0_g1_i1.p1 TRINITY_DN19018_c0_g1~~TRINITY_DN19018_c0_g1_i1.p1  ORF type:complete len:280 (-),score=47.04 TRINITY_DN19018_c0_g1_i1:685-1524(-)
MGDSIAEELVQLIRGFSTSLTLKLSHVIALLFRYKNVSSIGAVAGFAIALVCTWKLLRGPSNRRRRFEKRDTPSSSQDAGDGSELSATGTSTAAARSITQAGQRGVVIREVPPPVQLTLAQMVRKQLNGGRKMTMQLLGIVLEESTVEELEKHAVVRPAVVDVLLEISRACDLYLVSRVLDDESEAAVLAALDAVGVFSVGGLNRNKVLFCSSEAGRTSFVRQLEPDWHVDTAATTLSQLARFIRYQLHIAPPGALPVAVNVFGSDSLERYFGLPTPSD